jgi:hypothetical protein
MFIYTNVYMHIYAYLYMCLYIRICISLCKDININMYTCIDNYFLAPEARKPESKSTRMSSSLHWLFRVLSDILQTFSTV